MQYDGETVQKLNKRFNEYKIGLNIQINMNFVKCYLSITLKLTAKVLLTMCKY